QAMQISQAVKTVALELGKRTKKNEYGAVYGQLYREFAVTSYKQLPASQFEKAMSWLTNWYKRITGATGPDEVPF
ncbi:MAG: ORF6C domain-containing protein, partial [Anaerolineales bacterium]|nr:ORF6C domain-containing protein [Anaerolineales bacterium]